MSEIHKFEGVTIARVQSGANVNTPEDRTPLHMVAAQGDIKIVQLLLKANADVEARDKFGKTPLDVAREQGYEEIVQLLETYVPDETKTSPKP